MNRSAIRICASTPCAEQIARQWLTRYQGQKPHFACILSFTETCLRPQISAAGITPNARCTTALADGTYLYSGPNHRHPLPSLPAGISPAVLTRAILTYCDIPPQLMSTGLPVAIAVPHAALPSVLAKDLSTGAAMAYQQAQSLFNSGYQHGQQLAQRSSNSYWILGESVVGGTTTAQAILTALGYSVVGQVGSSHQQSNHLQKQTLVQIGLQRWRSRQCGCNTPMAIAAALGDPMQLAVAGMALAISQSAGVLLAGGAQMLAVYALTRAIAQTQDLPWRPAQIVVGTTRWVIEDSSADTVAIARAVEAPYLSSPLSFSRSPYPQLRAYERGFVKEGTGLGGCAIAARLYKNATSDQLRHAIESELRQQ